MGKIAFLGSSITFKLSSGRGVKHWCPRGQWQRRRAHTPVLAGRVHQCNGSGQQFGNIYPSDPELFYFCESILQPVTHVDKYSTENFYISTGSLFITEKKQISINYVITTYDVLIKKNQALTNQYKKYIQDIK